MPSDASPRSCPTTLALVAVFVPLSFMQGNVGRLFSEFGLTLAAAVAFSSVVALSLAPMLCSKWLRSQQQAGRVMRTTEQVFQRSAAGYRWLLERALWVPAIVLVGALLVAASYQLFRLLPQELTPVEDRGIFIIPSQAPQGSTPQHTFKSIQEVEAAVQPLVERGEAERVLSIVGFGGVGNEAFTIVGLVDWGARQRTQQEMVAEVFPKLLAIPGIRAFAVNPPGLGQSAFQPPVQFVIGGNDYARIREWRDRILARARGNTRLLNVNSNYEETQPQLLVAIDRRRAADLEISLEQIGRTLQTMLASVEFANQLRDEGHSIREAIIRGSELRFRPVLMTAVSTVFGALPLVLATGAGAESRIAIGVVIVGGIGFATILTLFVIPVLYALLARFTRPAGAIAQKLTQLEAEERSKVEVEG